MSWIVVRTIANKDVEKVLTENIGEVVCFRQRWTGEDFFIGVLYQLYPTEEFAKLIDGDYTHQISDSRSYTTWLFNHRNAAVDEIKWNEDDSETELMISVER